MSIAGSAFWTRSLAALLVAACGGKGSANPGPTSGQGGESGQAGASVQAGASGLAGSATGSSGTAGNEANDAAGLPCVNDPLERLGPCQVVGERPVPGPRPICPESEPSVAEACTDPGIVCGYGDSVTPTCRTYYECAGTTWRLDPRGERYPCDEPPPGFCPPDPPPHNTSCTPVPGRAPCVYAGVTCGCVSGMHWATFGEQWLCYGPPSDPTCPETLPNIGEGCATQGVQCSYIEDCDLPPYSTVFCRNGAWEEGERTIPCNL